MVDGIRSSSQKGQEEQGQRVYVGQLQGEDRFECEEARFLWSEIFCRQIEMGR